MSNFAALIDVLSVAGSRLSDGTANASGKVWFFEPSSNTTVNVYSDAAATTIITQPVTLTDGGLLDLADFPNGIYVTQPVRLYIEDVNATAVSDTTYIPATAGDVGIDNDATTATTLDAWITQAQTSTGGTDFSYQESGGATERPIQDKFRELGISVKDFGAIGDGIAIDTTAIQSAMNRAKALSTTVLFPAGTYKIDQALTLNSATGVSLVGAGPDATVIQSSNTSANCFTITGCDSFQVRGMTISHVTTSTGTAFALDTCNAPTFAQIVHEGDTSVGWRIALSLVASPRCTVTNCTLEGESSSAAGRGIALGTNSGALKVIGGSLEAVTGNAFEVSGNSGECLFVGVGFSTRASFVSGLSGTGFVFVGCTGLELTVATATIPSIRLVASAPFGSSGSAATGGNVTPSLIGGNIITLTASSGGAGTVTVNNPAIFPVSATGQFWDFLLVNTAGGAITWSFGAAYRLNGAVSNNNGQTTVIRFYCDGTTIREASFRAVTTT